MKNLFLIGATLAALTSSALAADLGPQTYTKAAPVYASPVYNWSGFYIGAQGGYGWSDSQGLSVEGGFGGGTAGYNWQNGAFVYGIEIEGAGGDIKQSASVLGLATVSTKVDAFGSVTGRIGWAANEWLFYGKGGYGWVENKLGVSVLGVGISDSQTHGGYVIGGGIEYGLAPNWSIKGEYLFQHMDSKNYFDASIPGGLASGEIDLQTVKFGVNYHFH